MLHQWIVKAFEGGKPTLHIFIQYRLKGQDWIGKTNGV